MSDPLGDAIGRAVVDATSHAFPHGHSDPCAFCDTIDDDAKFHAYQRAHADPHLALVTDPSADDDPTADTDY